VNRSSEQESGVQAGVEAMDHVVRPGGGACPRVLDTVQARVQAAPLRVNEVGAAVSPVWLAWKPMVVDVPGAISAL
jgi:hypothetical protein